MGVDEVAVDTALLRAWQKGVVFLSKEVFFEKTRLFRGSRGISKNVRAYHKYIPPPDPHAKEFSKNGIIYVPYSRLR